MKSTPNTGTTGMGKADRSVAWPLLFLMFLMSSSISGSEQKWDGQTKVVDGVTIIENRGPGIFGKSVGDKIKLIEVLSLGADADNDPEYLIFGQHIMMDVDRDGNMFVLDVQNSRLMKFDREGRFLWKAGRRGQGPGEMEYPSTLKALENGGVVLVEGTKLQYFDRDGIFLNMVTLSKPIKSIISMTKDEIFANMVIRGQPGLSAATFSASGELINNFPVEYHYGPKLSPRLVYDLGAAFVLGEGRLFLSLPDKYEIQVYSMEGQLLKKVTRDIRVRPPVLEEGYRFLMRDRSGPCQLISNGFLVNRLLLSAEGEESTEKKFIDFFNDKFEFLGSYPIRNTAYLAKIDGHNNFYFVQSDPYLKIVKYALKIQ